MSQSAATVAALQQMKQAGRKIACVVAWDTQMAKIADRAGVDMVSVGDSVGMNLWGHANPEEITLEEMLVVCKAVRRGVRRALLSADVPYGPMQRGVEATVAAAMRMVREGGADMVKLDAAAEFPEAVRAVVQAGIPVFAQFGITPQIAQQYGFAYRAAPDQELPTALIARLVEDARRMQEAGAAFIDFYNSGPVAGSAVVAAVSIPVIGGFGGGPWLDGRMRMMHAAIGYAESNIDKPAGNYGNVAQLTLDAMRAYGDDVRAARQLPVSGSNKA